MTNGITTSLPKLDITSALKIMFFNCLNASFDFTEFLSFEMYKLK